MCATVPHGGANLARCRQRANRPTRQPGTVPPTGGVAFPIAPGSARPQAHHLFEERADRLTNTEWMINLCNYDHGRHHDGQLAITGDPDGVITFGYRDGRELRSPTRPVMKKSA